MRVSNGNMGETQKSGVEWMLTVLGSALVSLWQSLPTLLKIYLVLATAQYLLKVIHLLLTGQREQRWAQMMRVSLRAVAVSLLVISLYAAGLIVDESLAEIGELLSATAKVVSIWFALYAIGESLDTLAQLGVHIPHEIRSRFPPHLRKSENGHGTPQKQQPEGGKEDEPSNRN